MKDSVVEYIVDLMSSRGISQSELARDIFVSRQQVSYVLSGSRDLTVDMAIRLESYFNLREGTLLSIQARARTKRRKQEMRDCLVSKLKASSAFWSYQEVDGSSLSDEDIIENTIVHLDMDEIEMLFSLYGKDAVKMVWKERLACQGEYFHDLNVLMAMYFFGVKKPERYLKRLERNHFRSLEKCLPGTASDAMPTPAGLSDTRSHAEDSDRTT